VESNAEFNLKPEWWGSPLVLEKYQEEEVCDNIIIVLVIAIIIIIIIIIIWFLSCLLTC